MSDLPEGPDVLLVLARWTVRAGRAQEVWEAVDTLAAATRDEAGCLGFECFTAPGEPDRILLVERYADAAAFEQHRASEHFERVMQGSIAPLLEERVIRTFHPAGPDGVAVG